MPTLSFRERMSGSYWLLDSPTDERALNVSFEASTRDLGFIPTTPISVGIPKFVAWFKGHYGTARLA